jgi:hypothetical protein
LQYDRVLAGAQFCQLDDVAVRQFQSVVVHVTLLLVHLPKTGHFVREFFETETISSLALKIFFKGKLRAR